MSLQNEKINPLATLQDNKVSNPRIVEYGSGTTNPITYKSNIKFKNPLITIPNINANITDGSQTFISISKITLTGFTINTWSISGNVSASFNWQAILWRKIAINI